MDFPKLDGPAHCSGRDLDSLLRLCSLQFSSVSGCDMNSLSRPPHSSFALSCVSRLGNLVACFYLAFFLRILMLQSQLELMRRDHVELPVVMTLVATTFSCF